MTKKSHVEELKRKRGESVHSENNSEEKKQGHSESDSHESSKNDEKPDKLKEIELQNKDLNDKILRLLAEMQNKERMLKIDAENDMLRKITNMIKDFIDPIEHLFLAITHTDSKEIEKNSQLKSLYEGVILTKNEFLKSFGKYGVERIDPEVGAKFDYNLHEAISQVAGQKEDGLIIAVAQSGWKINDKIIRSAKVVVGKK